MYKRTRRDLPRSALHDMPMHASTKSDATERRGTCAIASVPKQPPHGGDATEALAHAPGNAALAEPSPRARNAARADQKAKWAASARMAIATDGSVVRAAMRRRPAPSIPATRGMDKQPLPACGTRDNAAHALNATIPRREPALVSHKVANRRRARCGDLSGACDGKRRLPQPPRTLCQTRKPATESQTTAAEVEQRRNAFHVAKVAFLTREWPVRTSQQ